jgi:hypothetical protein
MDLFYKIHLQAFNVTSIVFYHSGPTFEQVLYSCLDTFVVDASDYSGHLIRHLLNAFEAFPTPVVSSILGTSQSLVGSAHQNLTCSQPLRGVFILRISWDLHELAPDENCNF